MPAARAKEECGDVIWNEYLKVSIIRSPFEVAVSMYFWHHRNKNANKIDHVKEFGEFVLGAKNSLIDNNSIYEIDGTDIIDVMIRYDRFEEDISNLESMRPELSGLLETFQGLTAKKGIRPKEATVEEFFKHNLSARDYIYQTFRDQIQKYKFYVPIALR